MKIRTQFIISMIFFAVILAGVAISVLVTNRQVAQLDDQVRVIRNIQQDANDLNYLSDAFLIYQQSYQLSQWESRYADLTAETAKLNTDNLSPALVNDVLSNQQQWKTIFTDMVSALGNPSLTPASNNTDKLQIFWSRIEVPNQSILADASQLSQTLTEQIDHQRQVNILLIAALIAILVIFLITNYLLVNRRIIQSILELQSGAEIIGSGNLDYLIAVKKKDEIGNLSRSFNRMATNLKSVMASKADLEREIVRREQAEEALVKAKDELEIKVKDRTQELALANEQLKVYGQKITRVQEEERKRIANELHDDTAQYLSILKLQLDSLLESGKMQNPEIIEKLEYLEKDADRAVQDIRRCSHELRPAVLEYLGLQVALEQIAEDTNKLNHLEVEVNAEGPEPNLSEDVKLGLFRIAQEALNNASKHAQASNATINLQFNDDKVRMSVCDNGTGFDVREALTRIGKNGNMGLMSMQERAKLIEGDLKIDSGPGKGTTVTAEVKLKLPSLYRE